MLNSSFDMINSNLVDKLTPEMQNFNFLRKQALTLLAGVNYMLAEAGRTDEAIIVIGSEYSERNSVVKALALNNQYEHFNLNDTESNIHLPEKFKIRDKVFWECSNKIIPNRTNKDSILQVLVNVFFIKGLIENSNKLKFIIVSQGKSIIEDTVDNFTGIIENFISLFPKEERIKLSKNVTFVVTQFNENNENIFLESLNKKIGLLSEYFPELYKNLRYLYNSETQKDNKTVSFKLDDIIGMSDGIKINISKLNLFLGTQEISRNNQTLIKALCDEIQQNISKIYDIINSVFVEKDFDIYESCDCSKFLERNNYNNYIKKFLQLELKYSNPKLDNSYFRGLQQLSKFKEVLDGWNNNSDLLSIGLKILDILKIFVNNQQMQNYYYVLDQQIKELLFFQEASPTRGISESYKNMISSCKSFIEANYFSAIKNIQPKSNEDIGYYREAIKWLNTHSDTQSEEIAKTKSICYAKIGNIYSSDKQPKEALANYNSALKYNSEAKVIYDKMAQELVNLGKNELAIKYYKVNDLFSETLGCFNRILECDRENVKIYIKKGDYLLFKEMYEDAAHTYSLATSYAPVNEKLEILPKIINAQDRIPSRKTQPDGIFLDDRAKVVNEVLGDYHEINEHY